RGARADQIFPFQTARVEQSGYVWFPRLNPLRRLCVCDRRRVILVRQARKMMPEFMDKYIWGPQAVRRHGAVEPEYPPASIRFPIHQDLYEVIWSVRGVVSERAVLERQNLSLGSKCIVGRPQRRPAMYAG